MNALFEQAYQKLLETQDPELEAFCDAMAQYIPTTPHQPEPAFQPNGEIDLDDSLYPAEMDWGFDKPDVPHTTVYIFNKEEEEEDDITCSVCDSNIPRNSCDHDQSILVNCGDDIICPDCPWVCEAKCGECTVCEDEKSDEEEEEADKPATTETPSDKGKQ